MTQTPQRRASNPRTVTEKSERTRERILLAAATTLSKKGYAGTRLDDVAKLAGIASPAIYYYFPSRDDLIAEVLWTGSSVVRTKVEEALAALDDDTTPLERIMIAVEAHLRFELELSAFTSAAIRNAGQVPQELRERSLVEETQYMHLWRDLFSRAQQAGQIRDDIDLTLARFIVIGTLNAATAWWSPGARSLSDLVDATQKLIITGLSGAGH